MPVAHAVRRYVFPILLLQCKIETNYISIIHAGLTDFKKEAILKLGNHIKKLTLDTPLDTSSGDRTSTKLAAVS
jgi:hypothetical protein